MTTFVVDASVMAKWFFPEVHSDACAKLISTHNQLLAPDLIWSEVGNVVWKRFHRGEITTEEATQLIADVLRMPLETVPSQSLLAQAVEIALATGITVYDAIYVALAVTRNCQMVTADEKLVNLLVRTSFSLLVQHVASIK